jgi:hypothetical protein
MHMENCYSTMMCVGFILFLAIYSAWEGGEAGKRELSEYKFLL